MNELPLVNEYFKDFPIEFKDLNSNDFSDVFKIDKTTIELEGFKYLDQVIQKELRIHNRNTVVINTPVGNGKSYAIIQTIKRLYEAKEDYLIFVASPFVSLVEQYCNSIEEFTDIPASQIYNYNNIGRTRELYIDKRIHVVTANTLLGNPGEDGYRNSFYKRTYLKTLQEHCENNKIKVVIIFDEIHDTIHNFKEEFIFNLWNWRNVLHKNFIISATFSEASKIVIEYLAELTDRKIQIIESKRKKNSKTDSQLVLHYSSSHHFSNETPEIRNTVLDLLKRNKEIDILSYSKSLARSIISDNELGKKLAEKFGEINDCTSENIDNQRPLNEPPKNRYDDRKCNIGTNFKSGVSIQKENHALVIILPPRSTRSIFKNKFGIFSSGVTSIVQAIARKRKKGEIHIILPRPDEFDYDSLEHHFSTEQISHFKLSYDRVKYYQDETKNVEKVRYIPLKFQSWFLIDFYDEVLKKNVLKGIEYSCAYNRIGLARLEFPPYKNFVLTQGEGYLSQTFKIWGADLSAYLTYCAFTNQFVNCSLTKINCKTYLFFKKGEIQKDLSKYFKIYYGENYSEGIFSYSNFSKAYSDLRNRFFNDFTLKIQKIDAKGEEDWQTIIPFKNSTFEKQLLRFAAQLYYGKNYHRIAEPNNFDLEYTRSDYFIECMSCAKGLDCESTQYDEIHSEKILAFQNLNYFREKLEGKIRTHVSGYKYLPVKPFGDFFSGGDELKFIQLTNYFRDKDPFITNGIFEFIRNFNTSDDEKRKNSFYTIILEDFFNLEERDSLPKILIEGRRQLVKPIASTKELPEREVAINLIDPPIIEDFVPQDELKSFAEQHYGSLEIMYDTFKNLLNNGNH